MSTKMYNNQNIPVPICDANKLKYHLRMLLNILISLCLVVPTDAKDPTDELEWLNRVQMDYAPIAFKVNYMSQVFRGQHSQTEIEKMTWLI